jgi:anti-sigma regulatory factor (Ser/Thr protein kinase)
VGLQRASKQFAGRSETLSSSRAFVKATLAAWGLHHLEDIAALLSNELASNAIQHAGGAYQLTIELDPPQLRVEVIDPSPALPAVPATRGPTDSESGRGLLLVEALAARWGTRLLSGGKAVWFALLVGGASPLIA